MNPTKVISVTAICVFAFLAEADAAPRDGTINYLREDGDQVIAVSLTDMSMQFTNQAHAKGDLGGLVRDCSTSNVRCLNMGYLLAVPRATTTPSVWSAGGGNFAVVGHITRDQSPVWFVKVSAKGDAFMYFSYSAKRGVETISLQREGADPDLMKTYFLVGERGLLAER